MSQVNTSLCLGMNNVGKRRLKLYRERIKARGYKSLSKYVRDTIDRELPENSRKSIAKDRTAASLD